jgi:26S proteasome non-ATPase regulatory subunit 9
MGRIENGLHAHHAAMAEAGQNGTATSSALDPTAGSSAAATLEAPFARVNSVVASSPAESAGLKAGDSIVKFGTVDWTNHEKLSKVAEVVSQNEGVSRPLYPFSCHFQHSHASFRAWSMEI